MDGYLVDISAQIALFESIKYLLIFVAVFIEGPLVTVVAAALATGDALSPAGVFIAAGLGNLAADICWYSLGYAGRYIRVMHWLPLLRKQVKMVGFAREQMQANPVRILVASKMWFGVAVIPTLIAAGLLHVPWCRLIPAAIACELVWTGCLVLIGYVGAGYLGQIENVMAWLTFYATITLLSGLIMVILSRISWACCKNGPGDMQ